MILSLPKDFPQVSLVGVLATDASHRRTIRVTLTVARGACVSPLGLIIDPMTGAARIGKIYTGATGSVIERAADPIRRAHYPRPTGVNGNGAI